MDVVGKRSRYRFIFNSLEETIIIFSTEEPNSSQLFRNQVSDQADKQRSELGHERVANADVRKETEYA